MDTPERTYEIQEVTRLTGLSPTRLRAWERRYRVIRPERQANGYRAYSSGQVALLRAFAQLVGAGRRIGDLVHLPAEQVLAEARAGEPDDSPLGAIVAVIAALDRERVEAMVAQQLALRGLGAFAEQVVLPLAEQVGDLWALGRIPIAAEHLASEVVLLALKGGLRASRGQGPLVVAACLPRDRHEWGLLCTLAMVHEAGWRVHYLGPDLPVDEVAEAAWRLRPASVALSASAPVEVEGCLAELLRLPSRLPPETRAVIGGAGAPAYRRDLTNAGLRVGMTAADLLASG